MQQYVLWPTLAILTVAGATIPAVENATMRSVLYWVVLSPLALGLATVIYLTSIR